MAQGQSYRGRREVRRRPRLKYALVSKVFLAIGIYTYITCTRVQVHVEYKAYAVSDFTVLTSIKYAHLFAL
jgi:cell division protein FtsL